MRHEEILLGVKEERNTLQTFKRRKANWLITSCIGAAFSNARLEVRYKEG
jgi:hypothetical protein